MTLYINFYIESQRKTKKTQIYFVTTFLYFCFVNCGKKCGKYISKNRFKKKYICKEKRIKIKKMPLNETFFVD